MKRNIFKVNAVFNEKIESKIDELEFLDHQLLFKDKTIDVKDIKKIDVSMCSSQAGVNGTYNLYRLNYYVDLNISALDQNYSFQIMNTNTVLDIFAWIKANDINYSDNLAIEAIFNKYSDKVDRWNYINRNFGKWAKEYDLDNPRENYFDSITEGFIDTLEDAEPFVNKKLLKKADFTKLKDYKDSKE